MYGVCGITGSQGGAVAQQLLNNNLPVVGLTRNPGSNKAQVFLEQGVVMKQADFDQPETLVGVFDGCKAVFVVTNFWEHMNPKREYQQAVNIIDSCVRSNVNHIVWSTLENTLAYTDNIPMLGQYKVPHFDEKGRVSDYLKKLNIHQTHLYTSFFNENLTGMMKLTQDNNNNVRTLCLPMGDCKLPVVTVEDIGKMTVQVMVQGIYGDVGVASEHLTGNEIAQCLSEALNAEVQYVSVPAATYRNFGFPGCQDLANMFEFKQVHNEQFCQQRNMQNVCSLINPTPFSVWCINNRNLL
jgi:uncharacterized protein YbjT (DUF2867 family)